ncbi:growth factor receptor-bound protein 2-B-like [Poecilia reticulata]|uniref:growth factor receptor-bound protein 2-B-like n=1 Tax=Poecilia reticulata TaxID=8081 RepID=UPI0004A27F15|nr:PREDICTED: growth factor receptor-bound protein 2-B-like [Poecilia reticulata]
MATVTFDFVTAVALPAWWSTHTCLSAPDSYAPLSFGSYGDRVEHFRVLEGGGQYYIWDKAFCSLNRLVEFYRAHSIAMEKVVHLRDYPSSLHLNSHFGRNPYPNPYNSNSLESIHSAHCCPNPSPRDWQTSAHSLKPVLEQKPRVARALCDYTPSQTTHLHFQRDEIIDLLDCSSSLSWRGCCRGRVGIFPPELVQPLLH